MNAAQLKLRALTSEMDGIKTRWEWYLSYCVVVTGRIDVDGSCFYVDSLTSDSRRRVHSTAVDELRSFELLAVVWLRAQWDLWLAGKVELPDEVKDLDWRFVDGKWQTIWPDSGNPWEVQFGDA